LRLYTSEELPLVNVSVAAKALDAKAIVTTDKAPAQTPRGAKRANILISRNKGPSPKNLVSGRTAHADDATRPALASYPKPTRIQLISVNETPSEGYRT
jgi:hypothetical protein